MKIPLLALDREYTENKKPINSAIQQVLSNGQFILGPFVDHFENEVKRYLNIDHAIGVASGTDALWCALKALGIKPNDQVITSSFTFFATVSSILNVGAQPVFADISPSTFNMNPEIVESIIKKSKKRPKAMILVHLYGLPCDMTAFQYLSNKYNVPIIEDAAQAFGAHYQNKRIGTFGSLGCFSLFPSKNLGAYGDAGMVVTQDKQLAHQVRLLRAHGAQTKYFHEIIGTNSRLDAIQAAILSVKLRKLDHSNQRRLKWANLYSRFLRSIPSIDIPSQSSRSTHLFHQYTIKTDSRNRDSLADFLRKKGIQTAVYYPKPAHLQKAITNHAARKTKLPVTESIYKQVLSLPIFPQLTEPECHYVIKQIKNYFSRN